MAVSEGENHLRVKSRHELGDRVIQKRNFVMVAARCSVFVFERVHCIPSPASSMDGVSDMVGERLSLSERLVLFQSVSKNMSSLPKEMLERKMWALLQTGTPAARHIFK